MKLLVAGKVYIGEPHETSEEEKSVSEWLKFRLLEFRNLLLSLVRSRHAKTAALAWELLLKLIRSDSAIVGAKDAQPLLYYYTTQSLEDIFNGMETVEAPQFIIESCQKYADIQMALYKGIVSRLENSRNEYGNGDWLKVLFSIKMVTPAKGQEMPLWLLKGPEQARPHVTPQKLFKFAQKAWLAALDHDLTEHERKMMLKVMKTHILPCLETPEIMLDFLSSSCDQGGSVALLALTGLFQLIEEKNLDYPMFYPKLYALLDDMVLHSRYRSRFFRLLTTFLSSTHLPAALVASFIKRLSRLSLTAPPAAIIVVIPLTYNLIQKHRSCAIMLHRELQPSSGTGADDAQSSDPFNMKEQDPLRTRAIGSSLWELNTLENHYHPNVATLAKILSQPFTRPSYNLEDFLDYSYSSMLEAELNKPLTKPPVVEYFIPKTIYAEPADPSQSLWPTTDLWPFKEVCLI